MDTELLEINDAGNAVTFGRGVPYLSVLVPAQGAGTRIVVNGVFFAHIDDNSSVGLVDGEGNTVVPDYQSGEAGPDLILPYCTHGWGICAENSPLRLNTTNGANGIVLFTVIPGRSS
jgi:hypothetical protein